jgi:hypothetical protein
MGRKLIYKYSMGAQEWGVKRSKMQYLCIQQVQKLNCLNAIKYRVMGLSVLLEMPEYRTVSLRRRHHFLLAGAI